MPIRPCAGVTAFALALLVAGNALAEAPTHLNQRIEEHVVLRSVGGVGDPTCFGLTDIGGQLRRVFPDGTTANEAFEVPEGFDLVVTDVEWTGNIGQNLIDPDTLIFLKIALLSQDNQQSLVFSSSPVRPEGLVIAGSDQLTSGFTVGPEAVLCPFAVWRRTNGGGGVVLREALLRGYLVATAPPDGDGDGVPDSEDACPDSAPGAEVDSDGCSIAQFCARLTPKGDWSCLLGDWKDDETSDYPYDCRYHSGQCVPY